MKKSWIVIGIIVLLIFIIYRFFAGSYNSMVTYNEEVSAQWAKVESQYQRRSDLIPNLVNTVKGYADFEKSTLEAVIQARAQATQVRVDPNNLSPEQLQKYQAAQNQVSGALGRLLVTVEQYPNLKANENFLKLQDELAGTENRIAVERNNFNDVAKSYNIYIQSFPKNLLAGMFNFHPKGYFESKPGTENAPAVKF